MFSYAPVGVKAHVTKESNVHQMKTCLNTTLLVSLSEGMDSGLKETRLTRHVGPQLFRKGWLQI